MTAASPRGWLARVLPRAPAADGSAPAVSLPGVFARGLAMGAAEAVPGVSGGTIAFVTGIYDELVRSLASLSAASPRILRQGWHRFAETHNVVFFLCLGAGMVASFVAIAHLIEALLASHRVVVFGFFFGLIAGAVFQVGAESKLRALATFGLLGLAAGVALGWGAPAVADRALTPLATFAAGALASSAWLLPGVSGAFVLLLLGLYAPLLTALTNGDLAAIAPFAAGLAVGVVAFSKLLAYLLARARVALLAALTGFLAGSLTQIWPWRHGGAGDDPLLGVLAAMAAGGAVAGLLALGERRRQQRANA